MGPAWKRGAEDGDLRLKILALALSVLCVVGCENSNPNFVVTNNVRTNVLRVIDDTPDLQVDGDPVTLARLTVSDSSGGIIYGPVEEVYDEEMVFEGLPLQGGTATLEYQRAQGFTLARYSTSLDFASDDDGIITLDSPAPQLLGGPPQRLTVRLVNKSDYPAEEVFVCVLGKDKQNTGFFYLKFEADGSTSMQPFGTTADFEKHSTALSFMTKEGPGEYSFPCPYDKLVSGRIYLSFGKKLQGLGLVPGGGPLDLVTPSATGAPDAQTLYEFMELSATIQDTPGAEYILFANTSVVDFFSVGLGMTLRYHDDATESEKTETVGFVENARNLVLQAFGTGGSVPEEFKRTVIKDGTASVLRVLSPVQAVSVAPSGTTASFLNSAIDEGWSHYAGTVLNIPDNLSFRYGYQWTGQPVTAGTLSMTCTQKPPGDVAGGDLESLGETCNLPKPTTRIIFFCDDDGPLNGPVRNTWRNDGSQGHKRLCSLLSAAINRGVFENYTDWDKVDKFFTRADGKYNHYAKVMHQYALDGKVYGFGYDDVYGQDPTLSERVAKVNQVVLTIPAFPKL